MPPDETAGDLYPSRKVGYGEDTDYYERQEKHRGNPMGFS